MENILIFADGASKGNPGPGGWGALISYEGTVVELGGKEAHTTNNRMELTGATKALERFATLTPPSAEAHIIFHTDSSYVINGITLWVAGWKRNSWLTKQKQQVLNRDIWEALDAAVVAVRSKITWEHVGGHVGIAGNERADEIASGFAEGMAVKLFSGARSEYTHNIENISHDATKLKQRSASKSRSGAKAYSYISAVGGVVLVHKTWDECKKRVEGKKARFKKALSTEDEAKIIQEFS